MSGEGWEHTGRRIEDEVAVEAPPEAAWAAWADPDELARWFVDSASGTAEPGQEMTWAWEAYDLEQTLTVVEADRGKRLVLEATWANDVPTLVEVTVDPEGDGSRIRLVQSGFLEGEDWDAEYEGTRSGWTNALAHLKLYLERYLGQDKQTLDLVRRATYERAAVLDLTRTPEGLARWLGAADGPLAAAGDRVRIELEAGGDLTGEVLSLTDWETVVSWQELEGTVTFQAFPGQGEEGGDGRMLGLRVASWGDPIHLEARRKGLERALGRLAEVLGDRSPARRP